MIDRSQRLDCFNIIIQSQLVYQICSASNNFRNFETFSIMIHDNVLKNPSITSKPRRMMKPSSLEVCDKFHKPRTISYHLRLRDVSIIEPLFSLITIYFRKCHPASCHLVYNLLGVVQHTHTHLALAHQVLIGTALKVTLMCTFTR